jgi:hypothetical protein
MAFLVCVLMKPPALVNFVRAVSGLTINLDADTIYDTSTFSERNFLEQRNAKADTVGSNMLVCYTICLR